MVVANAGPLISLAAIGELDLLKALFEQILIPQAVYDEVVVHGEGEPGSLEVREKVDSHHHALKLDCSWPAPKGWPAVITIRSKSVTV